MPLTRDFRETVSWRGRAATRRFCRGAAHRGDQRRISPEKPPSAESILRDLVNATIGFERLALVVGKPSKSLHRMLGARGNPSSENFFEIVQALQRHLRVRLRVTARAASTPIRQPQREWPGAVHGSGAGKVVDHGRDARFRVEGGAGGFRTGCAASIGAVAAVILEAAARRRASGSAMGAGLIGDRRRRGHPDVRARCGRAGRRAHLSAAPACSRSVAPRSA